MLYGSLVFNAVGPANDVRDAAMASSMPHVAHVTAQCQRDQLVPGSLGAKVHESVDAGTLSDAEAALLVRSILSAGLDTTVQGIGAALDLLTRFPTEWDKLRADPSLARAAFEEAIRMESPVQAFFRTTTHATDLGGVTIPARCQSAAVFLRRQSRSAPLGTIPTATTSPVRTAGHVGFGSGIHMCVGQFVARLEGEVMLETIARTVATLRATGPAVRLHNNSMRGLTHLPLHMTRAA